MGSYDSDKEVLTPEDGVLVTVEVGEENLDVLRRPLAVVHMELEVPISPIERPQSRPRRIAQTCNRKANVITTSVPGRSYFHNRDMPGLNISLHFHLWPQLLRHPPLGPLPNTEQVSLGDRHQFRLN